MHHCTTKIFTDKCVICLLGSRCNWILRSFVFVCRKMCEIFQMNIAPNLSFDIRLNTAINLHAEWDTGVPCDAQIQWCNVSLCSGLKRSSPSLSRVWSRCCATCWSACWLQKTPHQTVPRNFMSSILFLLQSGPSGEPCSKTRYCVGLWVGVTPIEWLHKERKEWGTTEPAELLSLLFSLSLHNSTLKESFCTCIMGILWYYSSLDGSYATQQRKSRLKVISSWRNFFSKKAERSPSENEVDSNDT